MSSQSTDPAAGEPSRAGLGIRVGRVGAVPVYLRPSWFAVAIAVTLIYAPAVRSSLTLRPGGEYLVAFIFAVLLLLSVFIHELGHAAVAAATGTPASHIVLDLWGGHTAFSAESAGPWRSIGVSIVGPVSNAVIALLAELALRAGQPNGVIRLLLLATARANLVVAVFNALPGLPLDGGRILEALVWRFTGERDTGTLAAGWSGRGLAGCAVCVALFTVLSGGRALSTGIWLLLLAGLLWQGAGQAIAVGRWYRQVGRAEIDLLMQRAVAVPSTATVATALRAAATAGASAVVVLDVYGRPAAVVDERSAADVPDARADQVRAATVAQALPEGAVLESGLAGDDLIQRLLGRPASRYAVLGADELVVGVLDQDDVTRFIGS